MAQSWSLEWSHGRATVHSGAGAIGATEFRLDDGRWLDPFHEAPWIAEAAPVEPGLRNLRGEWLCLPFGRPYGKADNLPEPWATAADTPLPAAFGPLGASDTLLHGYGANAEWRLVSSSKEGLVVALDYPDDSLIRRVVRAVRPVPGQAAIAVSVEITARRACALPFGFHPNFSLDKPAGSFWIQPGRYAFGLSHPSADGVTRAMPDARFDDLAAVKLREGGTGRFDRLPFADDREEILQLCGIQDGMRLIDESARVAWRVSWDTQQLPSCLLWMSNRGRKHAPWNGRNFCVGIEPVASAFDLGPAVAVARNPIAEAGVATSIQLDPNRPTAFSYRISAAD